MCAAHGTARQDQLLLGLRGTLDMKSYADASSSLKVGVASTHSLRELLISSSVAMEASYDTNVTALCTTECEPLEIIESFERLLNFAEDPQNQYQTELAQVVFPVFVHVYLDFVAEGISDTALNFYNKHFASVAPQHKAEVTQLAEIITPEQLAASQLAGRFRNQKYCIRMSDQAFQLLMQFLQVCSSPTLLNVIQRNLAIEVYGSIAVNGDAKSDQKKASTGPSFTKPTIPPLHNEQSQTPKKSSFITGEEALAGSPRLRIPPRKQFSVPNVPLANLAEFRDKLAACSALDPCAPSVALYTIESTSESVLCASLAASSKLICCGFSDSSVHVWSQFPSGGDHTTSPVTQSSSSVGHPIRLHSGSEARDHWVLHGHRGPVYGSCFSASGQFLLSASEDCSVRMWDVPNNRPLVCYRGHAYPVWDVAFSPVDIYFASASFDHTARLWSTDLAYPLRVLAGHTSGVDVVQFHPNGKYIATGSSDRTCRLWDVQSGQCVRLLPGSKNVINSIVFSPNGKHLASGDDGGVVTLWDIGSGAVLKELATGKDGITALAYSPDGTMLASGCHDSQLRVWNMRTAVSAASSSPEAIAVHRTPDALVLDLQFTHRNCLVATARAGGRTRPTSS